MVHGSGLFSMLACIRFGAPFVLCERFDPDALLNAIERHRCTWLLGLPFMFVALLQHQREHARNVDSLRTCVAGGDVCPPQLQERFPSFFGVSLRSSWVSTEARGSLTYGLQPGPVSRIGDILKLQPLAYKSEGQIYDDFRIPPFRQKKRSRQSFRKSCF
jgi:acyl-CoA synthetase (AMP-forming)/AMP-acid ligase II